MRIATPKPFRSAHRAALLTACLLAMQAAFAIAEEAPGGHASVHQQQEAVATSERIMAEAKRRSGLLSQYLFMRDAYANSNDFAFRVIFNQYLSWYQTWVGNYPGARTSFSIVQKAARDDSPSPLDEGGYHAEPAVDAIARLAKGRQAVFFNENHSNPQTRSLTVQMLARLRAEGFDSFASETLYPDDIEDLVKRGYTTSASGFYTEEPVYSDMINTAIKLGYRVYAYESSDSTGDAREADQARNLKRQVFKDHPDARLVVNAGYAHIQEHGKYLDGKAMAQHFARITDIDPLTIEQTMLISHEKTASDHPYYRAVMSKLAPREPIVFIDKQDKPWSLKNDAYDVSVFFPEQSLQKGRPTWLALGGLRKPFEVTGHMCDEQYPCMVEARPIGQPEAAIPADRLVIEFKSRLVGHDDKVRQSSDPEPVADLWLRPGTYEIYSRDRSNNISHRERITVPGAAP
ncbi:MAG: hypothetical protein WBC13_05420 [Dokdonella sp.]|jgi:hypothetical protein|uniref:hypothetical protein n=1 Tax=Dokdonella sp. TaxID=2291710 RepID=UPI001B6221A1|nr:hypothetical protein [Dokdonella sp.]MBK8125064.1 hypothetical protein [Dokdonella sp.]MBP6328084.1 hypothetical protein [Dokdonella sp.]MBP6329250.1 hypothetical protein [Dokdonella sp.]HNV07841.1 hypothetical protein [Dokdonella sp.]HPW03725.1 hypothetical protein [Dokdonella sp.]